MGKCHILQKSFGVKIKDKTEKKNREREKEKKGKGPQCRPSPLPTSSPTYCSPRASLSSALRARTPAPWPPSPPARQRPRPLVVDKGQSPGSPWLLLAILPLLLRPLHRSRVETERPRRHCSSTTRPPVPARPPALSKRSADARPFLRVQDPEPGLATSTPRHLLPPRIPAAVRRRFRLHHASPAPALNGYAPL
jgi:hypothetical protein